MVHQKQTNQKQLCHQQSLYQMRGIWGQVLFRGDSIKITHPEHLRWTSPINLIFYKLLKPMIYSPFINGSFTPCSVDSDSCLRDIILWSSLSFGKKVNAPILFLCSCLGAYNIQNQLLSEVINKSQIELFVHWECEFLCNKYKNNRLEQNYTFFTKWQLNQVWISIRLHNIYIRR